MDERPWQDRLNVLEGLRSWRSRALREEEFAENILTGAVPWSGPPSGNTSQASLLNLRDTSSGQSSSLSGAAMEVSNTRIDDRIVDPGDNEPPCGCEERPRTRVVQKKKRKTNKKDPGKTVLQGRGIRPILSDSRYKIPRGQEKTVWRLDQGGCYQCGCSHKPNVAQRKALAALESEDNISDVKSGGAFVEPNGSLTGSYSAELQRAPRSRTFVDWIPKGSSWSNIARPENNQSSWSHVRRGSSLDDWTRVERDPSPNQSNSFQGATLSLNPFDVQPEQRMSELKQEVEAGGYDFRSRLGEVERKLSLVLQQTLPLISEKVQTIKDRLMPSLSRWQRVFIDVFLVLLAVLIFVGWFSARWEAYLRATVSPPVPEPSPTLCSTCGQSIHPDCSSCEDSFSPFKTLCEHFKVFTNAFSERYESGYY